MIIKRTIKSAKTTIGTSAAKIATYKVDQQSSLEPRHIYTSVKGKLRNNAGKNSYKDVNNSAIYKDT